jgi:alanyl-tRNA synthetase
MKLDREGFDREMEEQRVRARKAREALGDLALGRNRPRSRTTRPTEFIGYAEYELPSAKILAMCL